MGRTVLLGSSVLLALVASCLALWTLTGPAEAAFPGKNGAIVFEGSVVREGESPTAASTG